MGSDQHPLLPNFDVQAELLVRDRRPGSHAKGPRLSTPGVVVDRQALLDLLTAANPPIANGDE
jgi:hypothetical protein